MKLADLLIRLFENSYEVDVITKDGNSTAFTNDGSKRSNILFAAYQNAEVTAIGHTENGMLLIVCKA